MNLDKRVLLILMISALLITPVSAVAKSEMSIYIDGARAQVEVEPVIVGGRVTVPVRFVMEGLGADVAWRSPHIYIKRGDFDLKLTLGSKAVSGKGMAMADMDVAPFLMDNRAMVPLRFISEALNAKVDYREGDVYISTLLAEELAEKKSKYFYMALGKRIDHLPEFLDGDKPDTRSLLMFAFFNLPDYSEADFMSVDYVNKVAHENFTLKNVHHESTKEWRLEGDTYFASGWSYNSACFFDLISERTYVEGGRTIIEVVLDQYGGFVEYESVPMDYSPDFGQTYSEPFMYVLEKRGNEIKDGSMTVVDAIQSLLAEGDTDKFTKRGTLKMRYYLDEITGNMVFTRVEYNWGSN